MSNLDQIKANYHTFYNHQKYEDSIVRQHASHWGQKKKSHLDYVHEFENKSNFGQLRQAGEDFITTMDRKTYGAVGLIPFADAVLLPARIDATAQRMKGDHMNMYTGKIEKKESTLSGATEIGMNTVFAGLGAGMASGSAKRVAAGAVAGLAAGGAHGYAEYLDTKNATVPGLTDAVNRGAVNAPSEDDKKHAAGYARYLDNIAETQGIKAAAKVYKANRRDKLGQARKAYDQYKQQGTAGRVNAMMAQKAAAQKAAREREGATVDRVNAMMAQRAQRVANMKAQASTVDRVNAMMAQKPQKAADKKEAFKAQGATIDRIKAMMAYKAKKAADQRRLLAGR